MIVTQLIDSGQFLDLSRTQSDEFTQSLSFQLQNGTQVVIDGPGIIAFYPQSSGNKQIVLSCGIHGNETAPIEICDEFVQRILTEQLELRHRVLFIFGNLPAMDIAQRFVQENLNRLFCGAHNEPAQAVSYERTRAKQLEKAVADFYQQSPPAAKSQRYHYDLHTAIRASKNEKFAVYPHLHGEPHNKEQLQFLLACGINTVLLSGSSTTTFSYYSSVNFAAHAFTVELGKVKPFGQNDMSHFVQIQDSLQKLICGQNIKCKTFDNEDFFIYRVNQVIIKHQADFHLNFADDLPNFSVFAYNALLAQESGQQYRAQFDGEAVVFPNADVAVGQRALLTVVPTEV
ncbi:MAG: succinylglutamate desuccinylase [Paraglaciecola sp.]|jgi:succinylglutamate desuccinylase